MTQGFAKQFQPVEGVKRSQHMRGIGALPTTRLHQALLPQEGQERIEEEFLGLAVDEAATKLTEDRGIKARVL